MQKHSEFSRAINSGKLQADAEVAERLYSRATGHSHEAAKIFLPAGATSLVCTRPMSSITRRIRRRRWLGCQPEKWKDRQEVNITGAVAHCLSQMTPDERAAFALDLAQQARQRLIDAGVIIEHQPEE